MIHCSIFIGSSCFYTVAKCIQYFPDHQILLIMSVQGNFFFYNKRTILCIKDAWVVFQLRERTHSGFLTEDLV